MSKDPTSIVPQPLLVSDTSTTPSFRNTQDWGCNMTPPGKYVLTGHNSFFVSSSHRSQSSRLKNICQVGRRSRYSVTVNKAIPFSKHRLAAGDDYIASKWRVKNLDMVQVLQTWEPVFQARTLPGTARLRIDLGSVYAGPPSLLPHSPVTLSLRVY